jgi:hypothetical protein
MNVGLPGTGLGGLFYLALVIALPFRELWLRAQGKRSASWGEIFKLLALCACIIGVMWVQGVLISMILPPSSDAAMALKQLTGTSGGVGEVIASLAQSAFFVTGLTLLGVVAFIHMLRMGLRLAQLAQSLLARGST